MPLIANARMYAATPAVEGLWAELLMRVAERAGVASVRYSAHPAPAPLEQLWGRGDLALAFMCGLPFARRRHAVVPVAVPAPLDPPSDGASVYATLICARDDAPTIDLAAVPLHRIGWTAASSLSGGAALMAHLDVVGHPHAHRLFEDGAGPLVHPNAVVEALHDGRIDVGPLDSLFAALLRRHMPEALAELRTIATTRTRPAPLLVASAGIDLSVREALSAAALGIGQDRSARGLLQALRLRGFAPVDEAAYAPLAALRPRPAAMR